MKKMFLTLLAVFFCFCSATAFAEQEDELGGIESQGPILEPGTKHLHPAADSAVLDNVVVTTLPDGKGQIMEFSATIQEGESGGYAIETDVPSGTYKATPIDIPEDIKIDMMMDQSSASSVSPCYGRTATGWLETTDPIFLPLCRTYTRLDWNYGCGSSQTWTWDACPSALGTNWFNRRDKNYPLTTNEGYVYAHGWAHHWNKDFLLKNKRTHVTHDVFAIGYPNAATIEVKGTVQRWGEAWWLLFTKLYFCWGIPTDPS